MRMTFPGISGSLGVGPGVRDYLFSPPKDEPHKDSRVDIAWNEEGTVLGFSLQRFGKYMWVSFHTGNITVKDTTLSESRMATQEEIDLFKPVIEREIRSKKILDRFSALLRAQSYN